jgi:hypothetical protein
VIGSTELALTIPQVWSAGLREDATEEMVVVRDFSIAEGVEKILGQLNVRKIARQSYNVLAATGGTGLTYANNVEGVATCTPVWLYGAVEINRAAYNRLDFDPDNPYRDMLKNALGEGVEYYGASLWSSLATNVKGSGAADLDLGLALDAEMALAINAKRFYKPGKTPWYLKMHPSQIKNLMSQFNAIASNVRGDAEKPIVSGWMSDVLGAHIDETGNIVQTGGVTHNLGFIPEAFVIAYNEEMTVLPVQAYELVNRLIATVELGVMAVYEKFAVDIQTKG